MLETILLNRIERGFIQTESVSDEELKQLEKEDKESDELALVFEDLK